MAPSPTDGVAEQVELRQHGTLQAAGYALDAGQCEADPTQVELAQRTAPLDRERKLLFVFFFKGAFSMLEVFCLSVSCSFSHWRPLFFCARFVSLSAVCPVLHCYCVLHLLFAFMSVVCHCLVLRVHASISCLTVQQQTMKNRKC